MSIPFHHPVFEKTATKALPVLFFSLLLGLCIRYSAFRILPATTPARKFRGELAGGYHALLLQQAGPGAALARPGGQCQFPDLRWPEPCGHARHRVERDAHLHLRRRAQPARIEHPRSLATATATLCHGSSALRLESRASRVDAHRRSRFFF